MYSATLTPIAIFARVSSSRQENARQISDLKAIAKSRRFKVINIISETGSATKRRKDERPALQQLIDIALSGSIKKILVSEISRIGRRPSETLDLIEKITEANVSIMAGNLGLETLLDNGKRNPAAGLVFSIFAELARIETEFLSDRIKSGQKEARRKGIRIGRPFGTSKPPDYYFKKYPEAVKLLKVGTTIREVSELAKIAPPTVQKIKNLLKSM